MSIFVQLLIYFVLAAILAVDGIRTLLHRENIFYKKGAVQAVPAGLLLTGAGGTVIAFSLTTVLEEEKARPVMWMFLGFTCVMMLIMLIQGRNR